MAALGELSFGVAHNVNNTLTGILGRAQLLLRNCNDPAKLETGIEMIIKSAEDQLHARCVIPIMRARTSVCG